MKSKSVLNTLYVIVGIVGVIIVGNYLISSGRMPTLRQFLAEFSEPTRQISAPHGLISAFVADTAEKREKGLSGRDSLGEYQGMLFQFSEPGRYGFWMKDMKFPIDIVWIRDDKEVAGVTAEVSPDSYPNSFYPPANVLYVLELNAGVAARLGIEEASTLIF